MKILSEVVFNERNRSGGQKAEGKIEKTLRSNTHYLCAIWQNGSLKTYNGLFFFKRKKPNIPHG